MFESQIYVVKKIRVGNKERLHVKCEHLLGDCHSALLSRLTLNNIYQSI